MGTKKNSILIIEDSAILVKGLSEVLKDKNNNSITFEQCDESCEIKPILLEKNPSMLIANPSFFEKNEKEINVIRAKQNLQIVAFVYNYHHPNTLKNFDAIIYLNDKATKIQATINQLLLDAKPKKELNNSLSKREKEILKLIVSSYSTKKIADTLFISTHTVNAHRKNIMRKLDIRTVSGLTIYAVLNNIISLKKM